MTVALPAVLIPIAAVVIQVRYFGQRLLYAATAFGAGFFTAATSAAPHITSALNNLGTWLSHL